MQKKEIKGYLTLSIAAILVLSACSTKKTTPPVAPTPPAVQSINPNDLQIPGITDNNPPAVTPPTDQVSIATAPPTTPATDPVTTTPTTDPAVATTPTTAPAVTATPTTDPAVTATPTTDPAVSPTATATPASTVISCEAKITGDLNALSGNMVQLSAKNQCSDGTTKEDTFSWASSDTTIATVDGTGKVNAIKGGTVTITASSNQNTSIKSSVQFKVNTSCSIGLSGDLKTNPDLGFGSAKQLIATVNCSDGTSNTSNVTWTTSDSSVATVSTSGLVEGKKEGKAKITATYKNDSSINTSLDITVSDPFGNEKRATLAEGKLYQPRGIDVRNGKIYVSAYDNGAGTFNNAEGHIKVLDLTGNILSTIEGGNLDTLPRELNGVASDGSRVWTINRIPYAQAAYNMYSFSTAGSGRLNNKLGLTGDAGTNFQDIAIDPSSSALYIASSGSQSIIKVNYNSGAIDMNTQQIYFSGAIKINPAGICVDSSGNVLVTNAATNPATILRFGKNGSKAQEFNTTGANGTGPTVAAVDDIAFDARNGGIIYVLAQVNGAWQVLRYDNAGNYVRSFGSGSMTNPESIAVGTDGTVYVADYDKGSILQFGPGK